MFSEAIRRSHTIVWNGPMGVFEFPQFKKGSSMILKTLIEETQKGSTTIIGGGDTGSFVKNEGASDKVSHVSTGGGASLELLEGKILPGIKSLTDLKKLREWYCEF